MKSRRTTSVSSSRNSHDDSDNENHSSDESDSDESDGESAIKRKANQMPVTFEYVFGVASPAFHYKLPKAAVELHATNVSSTTTAASSQSTSSTRKQNAKLSASGTKSSGQMQTNSGKKQHHHHAQQSHRAVAESEASALEASDEDKPAEVSSAKQSLFLNLLKAIREFFYNRNNWSVTEESIIIWFGFMFFAIVVGCILHFLMA